MDPVDRDMLKKVLELSEENNRMMHRLHRSLWWGRAGRIVYWVVIVGIAFGALYFLQPYVDRLKEVFGNLRSL